MLGPHTITPDGWSESRHHATRSRYAVLQDVPACWTVTAREYIGADAEWSVRHAARPGEWVTVRSGTAPGFAEAKQQAAAALAPAREAIREIDAFGLTVIPDNGHRTLAGVIACHEHAIAEIEDLIARAPSYGASEKEILDLRCDAADHRALIGLAVRSEYPYPLADGPAEDSVR